MFIKSDNNKFNKLDLIIIGASGGIGQYLINEFKERHRIIGTYCNRNPETLSRGAEYFHVDLTERDSVNTFIGDIIPNLKRPVMIYTPGVSLNNTVQRIKDEDWDLTIAVNITGAMIISRGLLPKMNELNFGRLIFISSILSRIGVPGTGAYSATKAALCALTKVIALENAKKGITANALALGYFSVGIINTVPESYLSEHVIPNIPQGHLGDASNIVAAINFIINADYLTGATIDINGGIISG